MSHWWLRQRENGEWIYIMYLYITFSRTYSCSPIPLEHQQDAIPAWERELVQATFRQLPPLAICKKPPREGLQLMMHHHCKTAWRLRIRQPLLHSRVTFANRNNLLSALLEVFDMQDQATQRTLTIGPLCSHLLTADDCWLSV